MSRKPIVIHTDGSCDNKTKIGGFGFVMRCGEHYKEYHEGQYVETTSSRMEIMAVIRAIELCTKGYDIVINCDNQYVVNTISKGWLQSWIDRGILDQKKNPDLWRRFKEAYDAKDGSNRIRINWVKGHNGNRFNELADRLANLGRNSSKVIVDIRY